MKLVNGRGERRLPRKHPRLRGGHVALAQIARRAGRDDVFPGGLTALGARHDVIEGQIVLRTAILAMKPVAQEHVEPRERRMRGRLHERLQRHHAGKLDFKGGAAHRAVVMFDDVDAVEEHRLHRVLPGPQRQRIVTQRPKIGVENQNRPTTLRDMRVQVTLLAPSALTLRRSVLRHTTGSVTSM